jgi:hypothetical protein
MQGLEMSEPAVSRDIWHRKKISNRRATQRCNVSAFIYAKICSLLARRRSSQPVQRVYWPENVIDWLGIWRPTCVMRHARGQKLQSFRRKWPFYMDLYSMHLVRTWKGPQSHHSCSLRVSRRNLGHFQKLLPVLLVFFHGKVLLCVLECFYKS